MILGTPSVLFVCAVSFFSSVLFMNAGGCCVDFLSTDGSLCGHPHADTVSWLADPPGVLLLFVLLSVETICQFVFFFPSVSKVRNHVR